MDFVFVFGMLGAIGGFVAIQAAALYVTHGLLRVAAGLIAVFMFCAALYSLAALLAGGNLWPLPFLFACPVGMGANLVVLLIEGVRRMIVTARNKPS